MGLPGGLVTFVLTDIEGSTRLFDRLGDGYVAVLEEHRRLIRAPFAAGGGVEVKSDGDGFVFAFADPAAAVFACLEAQAGLRSFPWPEGSHVAVRMGVHTGHAVPIEGDYVSLALHHASRLAAGASGGQVLVSPATREAALHATATMPAVLTSLGRFRLRDVEEPWEVYELTGPGVPPTGKAPRLPPAVRHNLPEPRSSFVGRAAELRQVQELVRDHRLVTLVGIGGVGKTRLAAEVAYSEAELQPDGALAVLLAPSLDAHAVLTAVAGAVGVREQGGTDLLGAIVDHLRGRQVLVLLDCCEHVLGSCVELAEVLLDRCPGVRILATSQVPLGVAEERTWRVPPLGLPEEGRDLTPADALASDAVQLFVRRAETARSGWELRPRDVADVVGICRQLDGIPLAIELAAARMHAMEPGQILGRLEDRFDLLTSRGTQGREHTLRAAVDWSYLLLDPDEQRAFTALSVFGGTFDLAAAEAVCGDVLDPLCSLVYRSLVVADDRSGELRYWMLHTLRLFAAERLRASAEHDEVVDRYVRWAAEAATAAGIHVATLDVVPGGSGPASLDADHDNLLKAVDICLDPAAPRPDDVLRLVHHLAPYWMLRGHFALGDERATAALAAAEGSASDRRLVAQVRVDLGLLALRRGELDRADASLAAGIEELGSEDRATTSLAFTGRALVAWYAHRFDGAHDLLDRADDEAEGIDDDCVRSFRLLTRFKMFNRENRLDEARLVGEEAAAHAARAGLPRHRAAIVQNLAYTHWCRGDLDACASAADEALAYFELHREPLGVAYCLNNLALVAVARGQLGEAARCIGQALEEFHRIGFRAGVAESLEQVAVLLAESGEHQLAAGILESSDGLRRETGIEIDGAFRAVLDRARRQIAAATDPTAVSGPAMTVTVAVERAVVATRRLREADVASPT